MPALFVKFLCDRCVQGVFAIMPSSFNMPMEGMMQDWRKYAAARNQLYHLMVQFRQLEASISRNHRSPELKSCLEAMVRLIEEARYAFEHGEVMAVQIDRYAPQMLPGFEEQFPEMKNPYRVDED